MTGHVPAKVAHRLTKNMHILYNTVTGRMETVVDPKGTQTKSLTNAMGQTIFTVQNFTSFTSLSSPGNTAADKDVATAYAYNGLGNLETLTAVNPTTGNQITRYFYEDPINASLETSAIYPDSSDTSASGADQVKTAYYLDGNVKNRTDQNGTVHTYAYDAQRRAIADEVTTLGSGVDGAVRKITKTYNTFGALETISSLDASGNVVNQNRYEYDTNQNLFKLYSNPSGAVNTGSTPYIQYAYDTTKNLRPTSMTYPSGTTVNYAYGTSGGIDDLASRPVTMANGSTTLVTYQYTGSGQPMKTTYNPPNVSLAYANGGLDRFGRIIDHAWKNSSGTSLAQIKHGYDYVGNRTYREDIAATNAGKTFDELYAYDGVNQLIDMQRGTLGANKTSIASGKNYQDNFAFDKTGNWSTYKQDTTGAGFSLTQARTHTKANEIASIAGASTYTGNDANGNMTKVVKPDNWSAAYTLVYDAWNRLVQVKDGSTTVATYFYDGTNRRVKKIVGSETRVFYFNQQWQCLEEYVGSTCNVRFVWGLRYVDDLVTYRKDSTDYYVLQDANWNVVGLTNTSGAIQERYTYSSFGKLNVFDASFTPNSASTFNLTHSFTGQVLDNETGLMLYRNRVYHPTLGRFIQRDPIGYRAGDVNLMRYVKNRISIFSDLYGLQYYYRPNPTGRGGADNNVYDPTQKTPSLPWSDIWNSLYPKQPSPNLQNRPWGPIPQSQIPEGVGLPVPDNGWDIDLITKWPPGAKICGPKYDGFGGFTVQPIVPITGNPEFSFEKWHREIERIFLPDRWKNGYYRYIPDYFDANRPEFGLQGIIESKIPGGGYIQFKPEYNLSNDKWKAPIQSGNDNGNVGIEIHGDGHGITGGGFYLNWSR